MHIQQQGYLKATKKSLKSLSIEVVLLLCHLNPRLGKKQMTRPHWIRSHSIRDVPSRSQALVLGQIQHILWIHISLNKADQILLLSLQYYTVFCPLQLAGATVLFSFSRARIYSGSIPLFQYLGAPLSDSEFCLSFLLAKSSVGNIQVGSHF